MSTKNSVGIPFPLTSEPVRELSPSQYNIIPSLRQKAKETEVAPLFLFLNARGGRIAVFSSMHHARVAVHATLAWCKAQSQFPFLLFCYFGTNENAMEGG